MAFELPPLLKVAERLNAEIEEAASRFPRRHKYGYGSELRASAREAWRVASQACFDKERRVDLLDKLDHAISEIKFNLRLGRRINVFVSTGQFEQLARSAAEFGSQLGGWKKQHLKRQSPPAQTAGQAERPPILSSHAASPAGAKA